MGQELVGGFFPRLCILEITNIGWVRIGLVNYFCKLLSSTLPSAIQPCKIYAQTDNVIQSFTEHILGFHQGIGFRFPCYVNLDNPRVGK